MKSIHSLWISTSTGILYTPVKEAKEISSYEYDPELSQFVYVYPDYMDSIGKAPTFAEADEILIQVSILGGCQAIQEIQSLIETEPKQSLMEIFKQKFNLIEAGVIDLFHLIYACIRFKHERKMLNQK